MSTWVVFAIFFCSAAVVINLNCDGDICKFEVEGIHVLNRVLPSSLVKFLRFPNAQLVLQQNMVPNLQSIIIYDDTDCACENVKTLLILHIHIRAGVSLVNMARIFCSQISCFRF